MGSKILGVKIFWGQKFLGPKFSSYIFIKSLIQNQTKLEFDFKDPVLLLQYLQFIGTYYIMGVLFHIHFKLFRMVTAATGALAQEKGINKTYKNSTL